MSVTVCVCGHFEREHRPDMGCIEATLVGDTWEGCRCDAFVLAGEQPALFGEETG